MKDHHTLCHGDCVITSRIYTLSFNAQFFIIALHNTCVIIKRCYYYYFWCCHAIISCILVCDVLLEWKETVCMVCLLLLMMMIIMMILALSFPVCQRKYTKYFYTCKFHLLESLLFPLTVSRLNRLTMLCCRNVACIYVEYTHMYVENINDILNGEKIWHTLYSIHNMRIYSIKQYVCSMSLIFLSYSRNIFYHICTEVCVMTYTFIYSYIHITKRIWKIWKVE